jgi:hypothetical protein
MSKFVLANGQIRALEQLLVPNIGCKAISPTVCDRETIVHVGLVHDDGKRKLVYVANAPDFPVNLSRVRSDDGK